MFVCIADRVARTGPRENIIAYLLLKYSVVGDAAVVLAKNNGTIM